MSESSINQERNELTSRSKLFGLPRPLVGAFIGIVFFFILLSVSWITEAKYLITAVLAPGLFAISQPIFSSGFNLSSNGYVFILLSASATPFVILGVLIFSKDKLARETGFIFLVIYLVFSFFFGLFLLAVLSD